MVGGLPVRGSAELCTAVWGRLPTCIPLVPQRGRRSRCSQGQSGGAEGAAVGGRAHAAGSPGEGNARPPHPHPWVGGARLSLVMTLSGALLVNRTTPSGDGAPPLTRGRRAGCTLRFGHRKKQRNVSEELSAHWPANTCRSGREKAFSALSLSAPRLWVSPQPRCRAARPTRRGRARGRVQGRTRAALSHAGGLPHAAGGRGAAQSVLGEGREGQVSG